MVYETSYESGRKPFKPDPNRGKWEKPTDFIYACFGLALKLDLFVISYWFYFDMGCKYIHKCVFVCVSVLNEMKNAIEIVETDIDKLINSTAMR